MDENENENEGGTIKSWFQENLRIIISIVIVVAIAGGIYSYSKRSQAPVTTTENGEEQVTEQGNVSGESATGDEGIVQNQTTSGEESTVKDNTPQENTEVAAAGNSQETEGSFIETAGQGDSATRLARRALANYLEKNPDSELTPEHKIYIEDYLRKHVEYGRIFVGTSLEFSKSMIQEAITQSKTLNDSQLKNLHKYAVMVPSLS